MSYGLPFEFNVPIGMWLDKAAPPGRQKRFGGLITTDGKDRQDEIILQKNLDLDPFIHHGWYNDNHTKDTDGIIGFPDKTSIRYFAKGAQLPDGKFAPNNGHWAEGYMLDNERGLKIWDTAQALAKAGDERRLGFSVEGGIQKRQGKNNKTIAKAIVKNVAITNCPVNTDAQLHTMIKSLMAVEQAFERGVSSPDELWKALGMGTATATGGVPSQPAGPQSGETAGQVLASESLEEKKRKAQEAAAKKSLTPSEAIAVVVSRFPNISLQMAGRIVDVSRRQVALAAL